jgi:hypothetical protein
MIEKRDAGFQAIGHGESIEASYHEFWKTEVDIQILQLRTAVPLFEALRETEWLLLIPVFQQAASQVV